MKKSNRTPFQMERDAIKIVGGIFRVRRDMVVAIKRRVLAGSGLDVEEADLLLDLYGSADLGWQDPPADGQGYVTFKDLQASLVHSPALLSRRITLLKSRGWIDSSSMHSLKAYQGKVDKKAKAVRITLSGKAIIEPVYHKYCRFSEELLTGLPPEDLGTMQVLLEAMLGKLRGKL